MPVARLDTSLELLLERAPQRPAVLATLVATLGSTYRKPGARMLIHADGSYIGLLSGGCLEADMRIHAQQVMASKIARAVEYDMRGPDDVLFGMGAGCEGAMRVLLEAVDAESPALAALRSAGRAARDSGGSVIVALHEASDLPLGTVGAGASLPLPLRSAAAEALADATSRDCRFATAAGPARAFVQYLPPPPQLLLCGAGPDAVPVAAAAAALGWQICVVDHRPAYAVAAHFPAADVYCAAAKSLDSTVDLARCHAAVVMSHHLPSDVDYLRVLAQYEQPAYIGLLGPSARRERIMHELATVGADASLRPRLHSPVGLDIGAATPEGIALAIIGQIHAWIAGRKTVVQP